MRTSLLSAVAILLAFWSVGRTWGQTDARDKNVETQNVPTHQVAARDNAAGIDFFEAKIRPVLVDQCYECHSADSDSIKADLRLDDRQATLRGGDSGAALIPGDPAASLIMRALQYGNEVPQMPPDAKLPAQVIDDFRHWIAIGAPDPRIGSRKPHSKADSGKALWSLQPLQEATVPEVRDPWIKSQIDRFILAKLKDRALRPQPIANRRVLIRRAYFDLLGLPPLPERIVAFANDPDPNAYEKLVDRLLDDPRYGERWGRHWLDLARYADSSGYEFDSERPYAYHYRDFVIEALNRDLPFDRFLRWQIAGDELAPGDPLAHKATGFLACGPMNSQVTELDAEKERYNVLDDWVATIGTAMLGLTTGCARCHDHKFDPLTTEDYYRLASTFTTTVRVNRNIYLDPDAWRTAQRSFQQQHDALVEQRIYFERGLLPARTAAWLQTGPGTNHSPWLVLEADDMDTAGWQAPSFTRFHRRDDGAYVVAEVNGEIASISFNVSTPLTNIRAIKLEVLPDDSLPGFGPGLGDDGFFQLNSIRVSAKALTGKSNSREPSADEQQLVRAKLINLRHGTVDGTTPAAGPNEAGLWEMSPNGPHGQWAIWDLEQPLGFPQGSQIQIAMSFPADNQQFRKALGCFRISIATGNRTPAPLSHSIDHAEFVKAQRGLAKRKTDRSDAEIDAIEQLAARYDSDWQQLQQRVIDSWHSRPWPQIDVALVTTEGKSEIPMRMAFQGPDYYDETFLLQRGSVNRKVHSIQPGFLSVLARDDQSQRDWFAKPPSGARTTFQRAALANWITDVDHGGGHLVARVIVNRLWHHHLGQGLVNTPNDFGRRGQPPSHPKLLDWLAGELVRRGWSLKSIHRLIMTSAVYMQSATVDPSQGSPQTDGQRIDPDNRLLWRRPLVRLEAESIRDAMLAISGRLHTRSFGPGTLDESMTRRSIYFTVKRSQLIPMLVQLDWPDTLNGIGRRPVTTVAPQSLLMLNNPQVRASAKAFATRLLPGYAASPDAAVDNAFESAIGRQPTDLERSASLDFLRHQVDSHDGDTHAALTDYCQMLFGMNEFFYVR